MENKKIILAVDDDILQHKLFEEILLPVYDLRIAKSAGDALHFLNSNSADLILLDILMPNIDGFEFLEDIRKIPSYITKPIIIVTGNTESDFLIKARNSSAADVLIKPIPEDVLIKTIEKTLAKEV
jgi:CheY-like chemotaxis protein